MWIKGSRDGLARHLSRETAQDWKAFAVQYQKLTESKLGSLEDWVRRNTVTRGPDFEKSVSDLEWTLHRGGSQQSIWWTRDQISNWQKSKYNWKFMITFGDLLRFDQVGKDFKLSKTRIKKIQKSLLPLLGAAKLKESFGSRLEGPEGSEEVQTLRILLDENGKSMYETRIGQVIDKIQQKLKDHVSNAPFSKLPGHLLPDLSLLVLLRGTHRSHPDTFKMDIRHYEFFAINPHAREMACTGNVPQQRIIVEPALIATSSLGRKEAPKKYSGDPSPTTLARLSETQTGKK